MDSLTQIILGAAVGEVAMGKKLGNRAMVWGGIAGTIPDLDIIANFFMNDIEALAVHRGLSHSIFFAVLFPWVLAWLTDKIYSSGVYKKAWFRWLGLSIGIIFFALIGGVFNLIVAAISGGPNYYIIALSVLLGGLFFFRVYKRQRSSEVDNSNLTYMNWVKLHFWAIFTHPLLDSCTTYGTQLFQPFSDYRVALNNISVADPAYTVPFLLFLLTASLFTKKQKWRKVFNYGGLAVSSLYLIWTFGNKFKVNRIFEESLAKEEIVYERYMTSPTILNNVLWYCIAEGDEQYYRGFYSLFDKAQEIKIDSVPKNWQLIEGFEKERPVEVLQWFSNGYYNFLEREDGLIQLNDLRFGSIGEETGKQDPSKEFIFSFLLEKSQDGLEVRENKERPGRTDETFKAFVKRIKGI
jgi:inner membrane protein